MCLGDDEATRKGQVLTLLAEQALQCLDFKASYIHCQDLMAAGRYSRRRWETVMVCSKVVDGGIAKCNEACREVNVTTVV